MGTDTHKAPITDKVVTIRRVATTLRAVIAHTAIPRVAITHKAVITHRVATAHTVIPREVTRILREATAVDTAILKEVIVAMHKVAMDSATDTHKAVTVADMAILSLHTQ